MKKLLILLLLFISFSCSSRKAETKKKVEKLTEITQNDIKTEKLEIFESKTISSLQEKNIKATPKDPNKPSSLNVNGNTVNFQNASIELSDKKEDVSNTTKGTSSTKQEDKSSRTKDAVIKDKGKKIERKSASWGLNIGIILGIIVLIIVGYLYFKTKTPTE